MNDTSTATTTAAAPAPHPEAFPASHPLDASFSTPAVAATGLHKSFGSVHAVDDLDLTITPGEVVAFLGPNGAGKSTTLDMILGFTRPDTGTVRVLGTSPVQAVAAGRVGAVLQDGGLLEDFTVGQTLRVAASMQARTAPLETLVVQAHLADVLGRKVGRCSGGERQRLRLALSLLPDPDLLLLDEPTAGMDVSARISFWETMRTQTRQGRTVLFATHYLEEASSFADRIVIIAHGRLVADGSVDEIRALGSGSLVTAFWPRITEAALTRAMDDDTARVPALATSILSTAVRGEHVEIRTTDPDAVARWLLTATDAEHLGITATSLDEVFTSLTADDGAHA